MRILFVDDEQAVLDGLSRSLFHLSDSWEVETALGGAEAVAMLADEHFDVVVTDMRMPGMDGAALLEHVYQGFPDTLRIVLSGHTEQAAAVRAARVAHQFLSKPCSAEDLEAVVQRASELRELLTPGALRESVGHLKALPPVPRLYAQLSQMLDDDSVGIAEVAKLIESDPAMSAKTLQIVNTSFFGIGRRITRVHDAVSRLGLEMVRNLAMMQEVYGAGAFDGLVQERLEAEAHHAMVVATLASRFFEADRNQRDDAFMAGMLHDVGKLVLWSESPDWETLIDELVADTGCERSEAEASILGADHAQVGAYLLGVWGLPNRVVNAVAFHHRPGRPTGEAIDLLGAVHVAECLARGQLPEAPYVNWLGNESERQEWLAQARALRDTAVEGDT